NEDALFHRLDVHVARLALDGALHDEIDEVDDRRRFAALFQAGDRLEYFFFGTPRERGVAPRRFFAARATRRRCGRDDREIAARLRSTNRQRFVRIAGVDRIDNVATRRDNLLDAIAGLELKILHEAEEQRV